MDEYIHIYKRGKSMTNRYLSAKEVAKLLGIAESTAYTVIRGWNQELKQAGYFVKAGSIPKAYFEKKCYGFCKAK